jgi:probable F420-dependent oxidoreductase
MTQEWEQQLDGAGIGRAIQVADELGFNKVMLGEHFVVPREHIALSGDHYFHTQVALAFAAGQTKRIKLSSSVNILPLQHPAVQAKAWSTLDWLSGGRAEAMFGVGWLKEEYDILNVPFHERGKMCDEYIDAMIELWTKEQPKYEGKYVSFDNIGFAPKPLQKPLPIWFGGDARPVLRRVGRVGHGWSPFQTPPEKFPECLDYIRSQPEYDGRPIEVFFALEMLNVGAQHEIKNDPRAPGGWDVNKIVEQCEWLKELGVTETIVPQPPLDGPEAYLDRLRWVAEEVMPKVR